MLTAKQKKRLAKEARKLAMEIADGKVPELDPNSYCGCAAHEVAIRAGFSARRRDFSSRAEEVAEEMAEFIEFEPEDRHLIEGRFGSFWHLIDEATYREVSGQPGALVFPLLAYADVLKASC